MMLISKKINNIYLGKVGYNNPIVNFPLNSTTTYNDQGENAYVLTPSGTITFYDDYATFGTQSYCYNNNIASAINLDGDLTFAATIRNASSTTGSWASASVFGMNTQTKMIQIDRSSGHNIAFGELYNASCTRTTATATFDATSSEWRHVVAILDYTNQMFYFYINGDLIQSATVSTWAHQTPNIFYLGRDSYNSSTSARYIECDIKNAVIDTGVWTQDQIDWYNTL